ncbi:MAG: N-glycosylase/DNA lyase [Dictyoglomi bacterium]|jgi:N-glycosylase/DNA lyase|nr:N-glycosylase/DNA lyase [Dictyoglomota bacterium]
MYSQDVIDMWREKYLEIKDIIETRLSEFADVWKYADEERLFAEFVFCHLTPQSKAKVCWKAVECLREKGFLLQGQEEAVKSCLVGVRFKNNKAGYIIRSREQYWNWPGGFRQFLVDIGLPDDVISAREYLVEHVKGMGYKEASHFLRNIGFGKDIAILDRHILKNLVRVGAIPEVPKSLTKKRYLEIEEAMRKLAQNIDIPMDHLDLLLWYLEAGEVFK